MGIYNDYEKNPLVILTLPWLMEIVILIKIGIPLSRTTLIDHLDHQEASKASLDWTEEQGE